MKKQQVKENTFVPLSAEEQAAFHRACHRTLNAIGGDLFPDEGTSMSRQDVIECVLDGGGMLEMYGGLQEPLKSKLTSWVSASWGTPGFAKVMKEIFPFATYGL